MTSIVYIDSLPVTPSTLVSNTTHTIASDRPTTSSLGVSITDSVTTTHETVPITTAPTTIAAATTVGLTVVPTTTVLVTGLVPGPSLVSVTYTTAGPSAPMSASSSLPLLPVHDTDDVNSGSDSEMSTDSLNPPPFRGTLKPGWTGLKTIANGRHMMRTRLEPYS